MVISTQLPARVLGVYTAVIAMQRVISFFSDFGFGAALVQKKDALEDSDITTTFTIQFLVTLLLLIIVFLLRPVLMPAFKLSTDAFYLLLVLVFSIFLSSFKTIPSILLERKIMFQKLVIPQIGESIVFNLLVVLLILKGFGLASFTWGFLISSLIGIPLYYYVSPWPMRFGISRRALHHLKYGTQFQAKNILATVKDDLLTVILVRFLSFTEIGYIGFAQRLAFFVFRYIVDSVTKVTFSTYARLHEQSEHLQKAVEKSLFFVSAAMFPLLIGLMLTSSSLIQYFPKWHNKWEPAIISLIFFCLNACVSSLSSILVNVLDARGKVKVTLQLMVIWTIMTWTLTPLLIFFYKYNGVAIASFLVTLTIVYTIYLVKKIVQFNFLGSIAKPVMASGVMAGAVFLFEKILIRDMITLIFSILLAGVLYILCLYLLAGKEILTDVRHAFKKS